MNSHPGVAIVNRKPVLGHWRPYAASVVSEELTGSPFCFLLRGLYLF